MAHLIDKDAILAEIESLLDKGKYHEEYDCAYRDGNNGALYALKGKVNTLEVKEVPIWEKVSPDTGQTTLYKDEDKSYLERFGYRIDLKELDKLPKKNLKAQKGV